MRRLFLTLWLFSLSACAAVQEQPGTPLYDAYQRYRQTAIDRQIVMKRTEFFTLKVLDGLDMNSDKDVRWLMVNAELVKDQSHYEKVEDDRGCLTVNGYTRVGDPISVFIEYKLSDQRWLINLSTTNVSEKKRFKGFFDKAMCPKEAQEEIWRQVEKGD